MSMRWMGLGAAVLTLGMGLATSAMADDTGLAQVLHDLRREGNKLCQVTHTHYASSSGQPSMKAAQLVAKKNWSEFTAWEYGTDWGNPNLAGSPDMRCSQSGGTWSCDLEARPCKLGGGMATRKKKAG